MKIVAIMGSPRGKSYGYAVVREVERHMKSLGEVEFEYIFLKDANLKLCQGCYSCAFRGEDKCPLKDDRALIEERMIEADGLILSSPIHVLNVSWLMKNFMDRFVYTQSRPRFFRQKTLLVLNSHAGLGRKEAFRALSHALGGARIVHELHVTTMGYPESERLVRKKEEAIRIGAEKLYKACLDRRLHAPGVKDYLAFRLFKAAFAMAKEDAPACYEFYLEKEYYYGTRIGPVARLVAWAITPLAMRLSKAYFEGDVTWPRQSGEVPACGPKTG